MSLWSSLFGPGDTAQSYADAQANLQAEQAKYAAQLQQRLQAGQISQQTFDQEMLLVRQQLDDPSDAGWQAFQTQIAVEAAALPQTVTDAVTNTASWVGSTVGGAVGGVSSGLFNGIIGKFNWKMWLAILLAVGVLYWALTRGPLKGFKIKALPIPI